MTLFSRGLLLLLVLLGSVAAAQSPNTVTIKFDDGEGITGEVIEFTDDSVRLSTLMGDVTIPLEGVRCIGDACPNAVRLEPSGSNVLLAAPDGSVEMVGELLGIEDDQYVLATYLGEIRIDVAKVSCEGEACPPVRTEPTFGGRVVLENGTTSIEGILTGLTDEVYVVQVDLLGTLYIPREVACSGEGCPPEQ